MRHSSRVRLTALLFSLHVVHLSLAWRETLPPANTPTPRYQFLWTHRNGDDVFCDLIVYPGVDNRVLFLDDRRFVVQMRIPEKYDHNIEFYKFISNLLWLKPYEIKIVKGKTKLYKRLKFMNPGSGVDISYYRAIMTNIRKDYLSESRVFQKESNTPHKLFPVSSTPQLYGNLDARTHCQWDKKNPRIAMIASPKRYNHLIKIGNEVGMFTTLAPTMSTKRMARIRTLGYKK